MSFRTDTRIMLCLTNQIAHVSGPNVMAFFILRQNVDLSTICICLKYPQQCTQKRIHKIILCSIFQNYIQTLSFLMYIFGCGLCEVRYKHCTAPLYARLFTFVQICAREMRFASSSKWHPSLAISVHAYLRSHIANFPPNPYSICVPRYKQRGIRRYMRIACRLVYSKKPEGCTYPYT